MNEEREKAYLLLKFGTVKGWNIPDSRPDALEALQKWADHGYYMSVFAQKDNETPEQQQALVEALDYFDEIELDWDGKKVTPEEAKQYILYYEKDES